MQTIKYIFIIVISFGFATVDSEEVTSFPMGMYSNKGLLPDRVLCIFQFNAL